VQMPPFRSTRTHLENRSRPSISRRRSEFLGRHIVESFLRESQTGASPCPCGRLVDSRIAKKPRF
jgi:hypothetical protein